MRWPSALLACRGSPRNRGASRPMTRRPSAGCVRMMPAGGEPPVSTSGVDLRCRILGAEDERAWDGGSGCHLYQLRQRLEQFLRKGRRRTEAQPSRTDDELSDVPLRTLRCDAHACQGRGTGRRRWRRDDGEFRRHWPALACPSPPAGWLVARRGLSHAVVYALPRHHTVPAYAAEQARSEAEAGGGAQWLTSFSRIARCWNTHAWTRSLARPFSEVTRLASLGHSCTTCLASSCFS